MLLEGTLSQIMIVFHNAAFSPQSAALVGRFDGLKLFMLSCDSPMLFML